MCSSLSRVCLSLPCCFNSVTHSNTFCIKGSLICGFNEGSTTVKDFEKVTVKLLINEWGNVGKLGGGGGARKTRMPLKSVVLVPKFC